MKSVKASMITVWMMVILLCSPSDLAASRLWSALADDGYILNNSGMENANWSLLKYYQLSTLQSQGVQHPSGWGLVLYTPAGIDTMRENEPADASHPVNLQPFASYAMLGAASPPVTIAMGHVRRASSSCGVTNPEHVILPDPHPWYWSKGFQDAPATYTFSHNGTLHNKQGLVNLIGYDWLFQNGGLETFGEYAECGGIWWDELDPNALNNVIDSQIYFKWIMKNIQENGYDVLAGIHQALSNSQFRTLTSDENLNFLFSDGEAIWAYRRASSSDPTDPNYAHTLYWSGNAGEISLGGNAYPVGLKAAMSQHPETGTEVWNTISNDELVYLPRSGNVVTFQNFAGSQVNQVEVKPFHKGWNWVGFPVLPDNNATDITAVLGDLAPDALSLQYEVNNQHPQIEYNVITEMWPPFNINSVSGYKVLMSSAQARYNLALAGDRIDPATPVELHAGTNWVDYFLPGSQDPMDAFPAEVMNVLTAIKGQYWYMIKVNGNWVVKWSADCIDPPCVTMDYGSMYELTVSAPVILQWHEGPFQPAPPPPKPALTSFSVQEQPDYTPVLLDNIDDPATVQEVGVYLGDVCVGAETVDGFPVKMQVYNGNQPLENATVQVIRSTGLAKGTSGSRPVYREAFRPGVVERHTLEGGLAYYEIDLAGAENIPIDFQLHLTAYPNPFNPSTTFQFYLVAAGKVSLTVYDIMGREVETLNAGRLESGNHHFTWDGSARPSGIYFVRLTTPGKQDTRKIILMK